MKLLNIEKTHLVTLTILIFKKYPIHVYFYFYYIIIFNFKLILQLISDIG